MTRPPVADLSKVVDLYSGCGGFALGAQLAGFKITDSVEIDRDLHASFSLNFHDARTHLKDIHTIDGAYWKAVREAGKLDGVIGGPPCQGFSDIGRRHVGDERNRLVGKFFDQVLLLEPKFFVMENVQGILRENGVGILENELERVSHRYSLLEPLVLNASDFGLPTSRTRVFVIGVDLEEMNPVDASSISDANGTKVDVKDAISDLPAVRSKARKLEYDWSRYRRPEKDGLSSYAASMRTPPPDRMGWERAKVSLAAGLISGNQMTTHTPAVIERFRATRQGCREPKSRYPRLKLDGLCPTLRAGTGSDKGAYQAMRPIHPTSHRVISVREAARLQSFPDWFVFHPTIWHSFRMIGNSVPPLLGKHVMQSLKARL